MAVVFYACLINLDSSLADGVVSRTFVFCKLPSVLWRCWLGGTKGNNWMVRYCCGYLSGARCKWFAYGPADATVTPSSLASLKSRVVYLSGAGFPSCPGKKAIKWMYCSVVVFCKLHSFFYLRYHYSAYLWLKLDVLFLSCFSSILILVQNFLLWSPIWHTCFRIFLLY